MGYVIFSPHNDTSEIGQTTATSPMRHLASHAAKSKRVLGLSFMLREALIGFSYSGKTTLFQLMTSGREAPRGKGDISIGISRVPDSRLDVLTAMYNPRKRAAATVEFTDIAA